jgi:hypothetical protein
MAISLKEQLKLVTEVTYHAPIFDKDYYEDHGAHDDGQKAGVRLFYDFYAMENLWSWVGSGSRPKHERDRQRNNPADTAEEDPLKFQVGTHQAPPRFILPSSQTKVIDDVFEQVTRAVAKNLINYTHLAVVQEFQYLINMSAGWNKFRQALVANYNKNKKISREEFNNLVQKYIPQMKPYPDTVKRLLKYSKYFSSMTTSDGKDVYDVSRKASGKPKDEIPLVSPSPTDAPDEPQKPLASPDSGEPDDTDYNAEPTEVPPGADYDDDEPLELPSKQGSDENPEHYFKAKKSKLNEEKINPSKIKKVYAAMQKAGVTLDDVEKAYNHIEWGGAYGGPRWGAGAIAMLKLMKAKKTENPEDLSHIIDHIYDLQHNTGSLLNKGPMYVTDEDLNRRFRITHIARFLPLVSPLIRQILLRYLPYIHGDAELEKQKDQILLSPSKPFTPEEQALLATNGLKPNGNMFRVNIKFVNKKHQQIHGVYYEIASRQNGKYTIHDNFKSDVQAFDTFKEAADYILRYKNDYLTTTPSHSAPITSEKDNYINTHSKIKLSADREIKLLDVCKMGWRSKSTSRYYKAYFPGNKRFNMYAFSDGSYLCTFNDTDAYKVFTDWENCFSYCKSATDNAIPYPDYDAAKAAIGQKPGTPSVPSVSPPPQASPSKEYYLEPTQVSALVTLAAVNNATKHEHANGMVVLGSMVSVGKKLSSTFGKPYKVIHKTDNNGNTEDWNFKTWNETIQFITQYFGALLKGGALNVVPPMSTVTPTAYSTPSVSNLPPNSTSKVAYKVHLGISSPPKHSIRLTVEDEEALKSIGFAPKMVGSDVWYIHKTANDTVKFYANDTAKILFTGPSKMPVVTKTIEGMLAWLPTKYSATTKQSPLTATTTSQLGVKGTKAGAMFEKTITDAGFTWNPTEMNYSDGENVITIDPYPKSTIKNISTGVVLQSFANLPPLAQYLKTEYPAQKKSLASAATPTRSKIDPKKVSPKVKKLKELLLKGGFTTVGKPPASSKPGTKYSNSANDVVIIHTDNTSMVYNAKHHVTENYQTIDELMEYLQEKYGSAPGPQPNGMSEEEYKKVSEILAGDYSYLKAHKWHWSSPPTTTDGSNAILIMKNEELVVGSKVPTYLKLTKENGEYTLEGTPANPALMKYVFKSSDWTEVVKSINVALIALHNVSPTSNEPTVQPLTSSEIDAIESLVNGYPGWTTFGNGLYMGGTSPFMTDLSGKNFSFYIRRLYSYDPNDVKNGTVMYEMVVTTPVAFKITKSNFADIYDQALETLNTLELNAGAKSGAIKKSEFQQIRDNLINVPSINLKKFMAEFQTNTEGEKPYIAFYEEHQSAVAGFYLYVENNQYVIKGSSGTLYGQWGSFSGPYTWIYKILKGEDDGVYSHPKASPSPNPSGDDISPEDDIGGLSTDDGEDHDAYPKPTGNTDNISEEEYSLIKDLVENFEGFHTEYITSLDKGNFIAIKPINSNITTKLYALSKSEGSYVLFEINEDDWDSILKAETWTAIYVRVHQLLLELTGQPSPNLTDDQAEWVKTFVGNKNADLTVNVTDDGWVHVIDPFVKNHPDSMGNPLFVVSKKPGLPYTISYFKKDFGESPAKDTYYTFPDLAKSIQDNWDKYTALMHKTQEDWMGMINNALNDNNYHDIGEPPENPGAMAWENQFDDTITVYPDGTSAVQPAWKNENEPAGFFILDLPKDLLAYLQQKHHSSTEFKETFLASALTDNGFTVLKQPHWYGSGIKAAFVDEDGAEVLVLIDGGGKTQFPTGTIESYRDILDMAYAIQQLGKNGLSTKNSQKPDSILTHSEAKSFMTNNFYQWGAPPHSYDAVDWKYDDAPPGAANFGRIVISNGGVPRVEIYKTKGVLSGTEESWVVVQHTPQGLKHYNFIHKDAFIHWFKQNIVALFTGVDVHSQKETPKTTEVPEHAQHLKTELDQLSHKAGFNSGGQNSYGVMYEHKSGFWFQIFPSKVHWHYEKGAKEVGMSSYDQEEYLTKVLQQAKPEMSQDDLDDLFLKETFNRKEKEFDKILRHARDEIKGVSMEGTKLHDALIQKDFVWNNLDGCYMNEELFQAVAITPGVSGHNKYHLMWVDAFDKMDSYVFFDTTTLLQTIGIDGTLANQDKTKISTQKSIPKLVPSGEKYMSTKKGEGMATTLNSHDNAILDQLGFKWNPDTEQYKDAHGSAIAFFTDGSAAFSAPGNPFGKTYNNIPEMLKGIIQTYGDSSGKPTIEPSGKMYGTHTDQANAKLIKLNKHDEAVLSLCDFLWTPSENHYYKNKKTGDSISFYDTGTALYHDTEYGGMEFETIPHALKFLVAKYYDPTINSIQKQPRAIKGKVGTPVSSNGGSSVDTSEVEKNLGNNINYLTAQGLQVITTNLNEAAQVFTVRVPASKLSWYIVYRPLDGYTYINPASKPMNTIYVHNLYSAVQYIHKMSGDLQLPTTEEVGKLMSQIGYTFATTEPDKSIAYHNSEKNKVMYIWPNGQVKYAFMYVAYPTTGEMKWDIATFPTWQEFTLFVSGDLKVRPDIKTNTTKLEWAPSPQSTDTPSVGEKEQDVRIKPSDQIANAIMSHGYKWDDGTIQFVKKDDPLTTVICMKSGKFFWYGGAGTKEQAFNDLESLEAYLDWGELALVKTIPKLPTDSNFDYKAWGSGAVVGGQYTGSETIKFLDPDNAIMEKLGFKPIQEPAPSFQYAYVNEKTGEKVVAQIKGDVSLIDKSGAVKQFDSVKELLTHLWKQFHTNHGAESDLNDPMSHIVPKKALVSSETEKDIEKLKEDLSTYGFQPMNDKQEVYYLSTDEFLFSVRLFPEMNKLIFSKSFNNNNDSKGVIDQWTLPIPQAINKLYAMHMSGLLNSPYVVADKTTDFQSRDGKMPWSDENYAKQYKPGQKNTVTIVLNSDDEATLTSLGFYRSQSQQAPVWRYVNAKNEMLAFYVDGSAKYWPNNKEAKYKVFYKLKDAVQMIWDKVHPKEGKGEMQFSGFDYSMLSKQQGIPSQAPISLIAEDESALKSLGFVKKEVQSQAGYNYIYYSKLDTKKEEVVRVLFRADGTGQVWDLNGNPLSKPAVDATTHVFAGSIQQCMKFLWDNYNTPKKLTKTGEMPYSGTDYKEWYKSFWSDIPSHSSISLKPDDTDTMEKIGFHKENVPSEEAAFKIGYHKPETGEVAYFFANGKASYWINGDGPKYFNTAKELMQFLWDKYAGFIEENVSFKTLMKAMLE